MKNTAMQARLGDEILEFIDSRKSLMLSSNTKEGFPYASYAPFAITPEQDGFYILISSIAVHANNLLANAIASVLVIEDEDTAEELFGRIRINYAVVAEPIPADSEDFNKGVDTLVARHGERSRHLSELSDFYLFKLAPTAGRYIKGFGKAYTLAGGNLTAESIDHLTVGHVKR
jgi:hypothetical protein